MEFHNLEQQVHHIFEFLRFCCHLLRLELMDALYLVFSSFLFLFLLQVHFLGLHFFRVFRLFLELVFLFLQLAFFRHFSLGFLFDYLMFFFDYASYLHLILLHDFSYLIQLLHLLKLIFYLEIFS